MNRSIIKKGICSVLIVCILLTSGAYAAPAVKKDESVYVILNADGTVKDTIVSDWIQGAKGLKVEDRSILRDVTNIKGDETPKVDGENLIWEMDSDDLFYQGTTDKALPLNVDITYYLDGKEITAEEIGGRSGQVKICIKLENTDAHSVSVNGGQRTIYTPFVAMTVMNLSQDHFKDVEVNRGEVVSDGKNQVVSAITMPGLKDSLDIDSDILDLDMEETLEVTAIADNFDMGPIMIVATPDIPSLDKIEGADELDELEDGIEELKDAVQQLSDGADEIADNLVLFEEHFGELESGAKDLGDGIRALSQGIDQARNGALELQRGIGELGQGTMDFSKGGKAYSQGAGEFAKKAKLFADGTKELAGQTAEIGKNAQIIAGGAAGVAEGAKELADGNTQLSKGLEGAGAGAQQLAAGQQQVMGGIDEALAAVQKLKAGKEAENAGVEKLIGKLDGFYQLANAIQKVPGIGSGLAAEMIDGLDTYKEGLLATKAGGDEILAGLKELEQGLMELKGGAQQINGGIAELNIGLNDEEKGAVAGAKVLADGASKLSKGATDLAKGAGEFGNKVGVGMNEASKKFSAGSAGFEAGAKGLDAASRELGAGADQLGAGGKKAIEGADKLMGGLGELSSGASKLESGAGEFVNGSSQLGEGAKKLADGSNELRDGMHKFDEEGVQKIDSELSGKTDDLKTILDVKDELVELSQNYGTFTGLSEDMESSIKFIMKTDSIEGNDEEIIELEEEVKEDTGLLKKIKSWFKK